MLRQETSSLIHWEKWMGNEQNLWKSSLVESEGEI